MDTVTRYLETRGRVHYESPTNTVADVMRHLYARQHLGKAIIVCEDPAEMMAIGQRQWYKLSRTLQRRRMGAHNGVEVLKYTYTITQMQHTLFAANTPQERPDAAVYFVGPEALRAIPPNCFSVYLTLQLSETVLTRLVPSLPPSSLVVDYMGQLEAGDFGLRAKMELEAKLLSTWEQVQAFLKQHDVDIRQLAQPMHDQVAWDDALDQLLAISGDFLAVAASFQEKLDFARPLRTTSKVRRDLFEAFMLLAHRVRSLAPGTFSAQFLNTYADDTFYLHGRYAAAALPSVIGAHRLAGREHLANALMQFSPTGRSFKAALV